MKTQFQKRLRLQRESKASTTKLEKCVKGKLISIFNLKLLLH
ncbi:hypothetical protein HanXRQr2_Chr06g0264141 [Helianthus annuus]|uniref:Uncharacterized protein n=1 Tax=Helianthus annuus TaxID=4232 RepID=A0A9K3ITU5_HELAN|nr:hypothetical protein HanXRQr2_Chr06g0264141 [Helianthus annuus]